MFGDPLTDSLMRSFLIEAIGIFSDNSRQMPAMKNEGMVQAFSSQAAHTAGGLCLNLSHPPLARGARKGVLNSLMPEPAATAEKCEAYLLSRS